MSENAKKELIVSLILSVGAVLFALLTRAAYLDHLKHGPNIGHLVVIQLALCAVPFVIGILWRSRHMKSESRLAIRALIIVALLYVSGWIVVKKLWIQHEDPLDWLVAWLGLIFIIYVPFYIGKAVAIVFSKLGRDAT